MSEPTSVVLNVLNRNYKVSCEEHQMEGLCEAANHLTRQLGVLGAAGAGERAFISIALSTTFDSLRTQNAENKVRKRVQELGDRIDAYLQAQK